MARVSIEDCLHSIENRFALAMVAADRARSLMTGEVPMLRTKNKEVVTALREITDGLIFSNVAIPEREGELGVMPKNYDADSELEEEIQAGENEANDELQASSENLDTATSNESEDNASREEAAEEADVSGSSEEEVP